MEVAKVLEYPRSQDMSTEVVQGYGLGMRYKAMLANGKD